MEDELHKPSLLERLGALLMREPEDREQLIELLQRSYERNLLDADALAMIEGVMQVSEMQARDIMIPRAQMDVIDIGDTPEKFIPWVIETGHSAPISVTRISIRSADWCFPTSADCPNAANSSASAT